MPLKMKIEAERLYFISDMHFFHRNIIKYCPDREPFGAQLYSLDDMHNDMIKHWNSTIGDNDVVVNLGDMFFNEDTYERPIEILKQLKGNMIWIKGNHDYSKCYKQIQRKIDFHIPVLKLHNHLNFQSQYLPDMAEITVLDPEMDNKKQVIVVSHYPMRTWNYSRHTSWHLYGHEHGKIAPHSPVCGDIGIDSPDFHPRGIFAPTSYQKIKEILTRNALQRK